MIHTLRDWLRFRTVRPVDVDLAASGDRAWLFVHTQRRFNPVISIEIARDELVKLADEIHDFVDDREGAR